MAFAGAIRAGRAFVELLTDNRPLQRGLKAAQRRLRAFSMSVDAMGTKLLKMGAVAATPFVLSLKPASDLQEVMNKFNVVFGDNAKAMKAWGDEYAKQVGRSKRQVAEFLAGNQDLFVPLGFDPQRAEELSKTVTKLAVDLASFNNMSDADTQRDLQAALTGSGEVMKKYGVLVQEAQVKQELLNQGFDPKNATTQQKVMARLNIILRGTTAAQGDATRSAGSFANRLKALKGRLEDTGAAVGSALLPVLEPLLGSLADLTARVGEFMQENAGMVVMVAKVVAAVLALGIAMKGVALIARTAAMGLQVFTIALVAMRGALIALRLISKVLLNPLGLLVTAVAGIGIAAFAASDTGKKAFASLGNTFSTAWGAIVEAVKRGDLSAAMGVVTSTLQLLWAQATIFLQKKWLDFKQWVFNLWQSIVNGVAKFFNNLVAGFKRAINEVMSLGTKLGVKLAGIGGNRKADKRAAEARKRALAKARADLARGHEIGSDKPFTQADFDRQVAFINSDAFEGGRFRRGQAESQAAGMRGAERARQQRNQEIEKDRQAIEDGINRQTQQQKDAFARQAEQQRAALNKQVELAKQRFQNAVGAARGGNVGKQIADALGEGGGKLAAPTNPAAAILKQLQGQGQRVAQSSVAGAFSSAAALRLGAGPSRAQKQERVQQNQLEVAKEMAANLRKIAAAAVGGLPFTP